MAGGGDSQRSGAEAADPLALGRDRGRSNGIASRTDRRRAQLGLPLLLGPRLGIHPPRADAARLPTRGRILLLVAAARLAADASAAARPLSPQRRRARAGIHAPVDRLSWLAPGQNRQRRRRTGATGHLRRSDADRLVL